MNTLLSLKSNKLRRIKNKMITPFFYIFPLLGWARINAKERKDEKEYKKKSNSPTQETHHDKIIARGPRLAIEGW